MLSIPLYIGSRWIDYIANRQHLAPLPPAGISYMADIATKKYADSIGSSNTYYDGHSVDILRYADVLLSRAEALNEINGRYSGKHVTLINQVKGRLMQNL